MLSKAASRIASRTLAGAPSATILAERNPASLSVLSNGLRVVSQGSPSSTGPACLAVTVAAGTRHEGAASTGAAHFLEHMFFKGTESRTLPVFDREVETMGASIQACTSREVTQFSVTAPPAALEGGFDLLSDALLRPLLDVDAVKREKDVIDQEWDFVMRTYPEEGIYDHLHAAAFNAGSGLSFNILGDGKAYRSVTRQALVDYRDANYVAPKMVVSVTGAKDHAEAVRLAEKYFGSVPTEAPRGLAQHTPSAIEWEGGDVRVFDGDMPHLSAAFAWQGPGAAHEDTVPLLVLQGALNSFSSSRPGASHTTNKFGLATFNKGVEGPIEAEATDFFSIPYSDVSLTGFMFRSKPGAGVDELAYHLQTELVKNAFHISAADLARGKATIGALIAQAGASARGAAESLGKELVYYGRALPAEESAARIQAVTEADIQDVVGKYMYDRCPAVVGIGAGLDHLPDYNVIRSRSYFLVEAGGPGLGGAPASGTTSDPTENVIQLARRA